MVKFKHKTKDYRLVVKAKLPAGAEISKRELDFFERSGLRGFLKPKLVKKRVLEYTGPVGVTLRERMENPISKYDFLFIIEQLVVATKKLQVNAMPWNKAVWDIDSVFINETTKEVQFIYLPMEDVNKNTDVMGFIDSIIYSAKPEENGDTDFVSRFVYFLKGLPYYDPDKIEEYIIKEDSSIVTIIKKHNTGGSGFITDKPKDYLEHYSKKRGAADDGHLTGLLSAQRELGSADDMQTGLLNEADNEETGLLTQEDDEQTGLLTQEHFPTLRRVSNGQTVEIDKPAFRIGKDISNVDYFISGNKAVSRCHADIITRMDRFFVVDLNSTNKTFINDRCIPARSETEIFDGDRLRLGDEEFVFYA